MGGGFTVEQDIFRTLIENADQSAHQFVVLGRGPEDPGWSRHANVRYVPIRWSALRKFRSFLVLAANNFLERILGFPRILAGEGWLDGLILREDLDVFLSVGQPSYLAPVPFVAVQWDLQHRMQPQFPEVSSEGRWRRQESKFSELLQRATYVVCGTNVGKREVERFYQVPERRIRVIAPAVPSYVREKQAGEPAQLVKALGVSKPFLLYPAQFWPHKNHANLLLALKIAREEAALDLDLVLVGSEKGNGAYVRSLAAELGLSGNVHFLGFVRREDLVALYREAFALSYVTFFGPDNIPPLEAFALGCPVIASSWSGAEEQLGDAALLVDAADPKSIAAGIVRLHRDPSLRQGLIERGGAVAAASSALGYVRSLFGILDEFASVRRAWGKSSQYTRNYSLGEALRRFRGR